jgi:putative transposase
VIIALGFPDCMSLAEVGIPNDRSRGDTRPQMVWGCFDLGSHATWEFCVEALHAALNLSKPEIFNSDQGAQFTSRSFTGVLEAHGVTISMDGKGRAFDNIFVERLWRSVKYEEVYLKE